MNRKDNKVKWLKKERITKQKHRRKKHILFCAFVFMCVCMRRFFKIPLVFCALIAHIKNLPRARNCVYGACVYARSFACLVYVILSLFARFYAAEDLELYLCVWRKCVARQTTNSTCAQKWSRSIEEYGYTDAKRCAIYNFIKNFQMQNFLANIFAM